MPRKGASKVTPKTKKVAKTSHQNRLHRVPGSSSNPKSGTSSHPKCVSPYPTQSVRATRSASPLPLPVAQRGLVIIPKSQSQKAQIRTPSPPAPNTRPCACALSRSPASLKNPPPPHTHAAPRLSQISDLRILLPAFQFFLTRHRTLLPVALLKSRISTPRGAPSASVT